MTTAYVASSAFVYNGVSYTRGSTVNFNTSTSTLLDQFEALITSGALSLSAPGNSSNTPNPPADATANWYTGSGSPSSSLGHAGDMYFDLANKAIYGPKTSTWGTGANILKLVAAAANPDSLFVGNITRDSNGAPTSAGVVWPDGTTGTYTGTASGSFPGAIDSYTITYVGSTTKTYTQPTVTRDGSGNVTTRPAITVA